MGRPPPAYVRSIRAFDTLLAEYITRAWTHGLTRGEAGNALSACVNAFPDLRVRGRLFESWHLLSAWARLEVPCRAPPLPSIAALGMVWYLCSIRHFGLAFLVSAAYDGFLRTREMLSLTWNDVQVSRGSGVISLAHTKSGQRCAAYEASVMLDRMVPCLYHQAKAARPSGTSDDCYISPASEAEFYKLFNAALVALGLSNFGFRPYSLRRGGATAYYRRGRDMQATIDRGRWSSARVARIYINDGLAKEVELRIPEEVLSGLEVRARALNEALFK